MSVALFFGVYEELHCPKEPLTFQSPLGILDLENTLCNQYLHFSEADLLLFGRLSE